jgi:hypothetical protein
MCKMDIGSSERRYTPEFSSGDARKKEREMGFHA